MRKEVIMKDKDNEDYIKKQDVLNILDEELSPLLYISCETANIYYDVFHSIEQIKPVVKCAGNYKT